MGTAFEFRRPRRGGTMPGKKGGIARRLGLEQLEARQMLAATLLHTLNNPTPAFEDLFGYSVAISGNTIVVGAVGEDTGAMFVGSAYVFDATSGALLHTLNNPTPAGLDFFGGSVAIWGNTIVVGAPGEDRAYLFDATTGALLRTLNNPTPANTGYFGGSVAISGDTIVVGAHTGPYLGSAYGSAYVFDAISGALLRTLNNPTPEIGDGFGQDVAISGNTIVVGAAGDDTGATDAGSAYVFDATTGALLHTLNNPTPEIGDGFGGNWEFNTLAISGNTIVVGARDDDTGATNAGSAYVFDATTGALLHTLNNPTPEIGGVEGDGFGASVAISGNTIVVGARGDDTGATEAGSAYVFDATSGVLLDTLNNPTPQDADLFFVVAILANTIVVGAGRDNTGATNAGSAYVFNLVDADFNDDGFYDCLDIDALVAEIAAGNHSPPLRFDR